VALTSSKCRIPSSVTCAWGNIDFNISAQSGETQVRTVEERSRCWEGDYLFMAEGEKLKN